MEIILSRLSSIENQMEAIQANIAEQHKWKIIVQHFVLKMFEFDIEKQLQKDNFLSFFYEQPNVVNMVAKNLQLAPQLEPLMKKQQLELAQYLKSGMCCIAPPQNKTGLQQHKIPNRNSSTSHPQQQQQINLPRPTLQNSNSCCPPIQSTMNHIQNPYPMDNQLPNRVYQPPPLQPPPPSHPMNIPQNHYSHRNPPVPPSVLQNELAWLKQISNRPMDAHPQQQLQQQQQQHQQPPTHRNSTSNLNQNNQQKQLPNSQNRSNSSSSSSSSYRHSWVDLPDTARPMRNFHRNLPVTIERVPVAELMMEPVPKTRRLDGEPGISTLNTQSNPAYTQNFARGAANQESPYAKFQEMIDDLTIGRLGAVAQSQQQQTTTNPMTPSKQTCRKSTSRPMTAPSLDYSCGPCGIRFREKRAADLHFAKIHASRLPIDSQMQSSSSGIDQRTVQLLISNNKIHDTKDGSKPFSPSANNNNVTTIRNTSTTITPINNRVVLDEITISDDDDDEEEEDEDGNNKNTDNRNIKTNSSTISEISRIAERIYNETVQDSPENSTSSSSSYMIGSSKLSLLVGEKRGSVSSPKSVSSSTSLHQYQSPVEQNIDSPGKRSRSDSNSNSNFSTTQQHQITISDTTSSENMEIVPEINFYTVENDGNDDGVGEEESIGIDTERDELEMRWINENNIVHTDEENSQTMTRESDQDRENHEQNEHVEEEEEESPDTIIS